MTSASLTFRRKLLFAAVLTAATTLLLLLALEGVLRMIGYGHSPHFIRQAKTSAGEVIWRENRWATAPFFTPELVRRPLPFRLPEKKAPGTYRIFVLGSSAAMGDPEPSFSVARVLETMLQAAYPEQRFEVINAAITAINSHVVRGIAADCAQLEPDLFVVYEGNNEVIGPFGPAGVFAPFFHSEWLVRTAVWLKRTRTGQWVTALGHKFSRPGTPQSWGGMQMFLQQQVSADDPRLAAVRAHFQSNLRSIAQSAHAAGASTLLCTVLTNQRDFAPFLSRHRPDLSASDLARWQSQLAAADQAVLANNLTSAEANYRAALAVDDQHAELSFKLGRLLLQLGRDAEARQFLQRALDLDPLRFRTDSALNDTIRHTSGPATTVVDLAAQLSQRSEHGVIGDDLLYEHVHLTLRGAYEIAGELLPHIRTALARRGMAAKSSLPPLDYGEVRQRLGFTAHEQAMIAVEMLNRFKGAPFNAQADHANRISTWQRRVDAATALLARPDAVTALREIYQRALDRSPNDWILARNAGSMFVARHASAEAIPLLERAASLIDDDVDTLVALGWAYQGTGQEEKARTTFSKARQLEPRYPGLPAPPVTER